MLPFGQSVRTSTDPMAAISLLKAVQRDTEGVEVVLRVVGSREPPTHMVIQIAIAGTAKVQIQGRIAREAPWQNFGDAHTASALVHVTAVEFLRALATSVAPGTTVSVWAAWAW
jgi:hypothetical protein